MKYSLTNWLLLIVAIIVLPIGILLMLPVAAIGLAFIIQAAMYTTCHEKQLKQKQHKHRKQGQPKPWRFKIHNN